MVFTLTFNTPVIITNPVSDCNWTTADGGTTYTTSDIPGALNHFFDQPWNDNLISVTGTPTGVAYLDGSVFSNCANLSTVEIPSSVTAIYNYSFASCPELTSVIFLGNSLLALIDFQAFVNCPKLSNFTIPSSVTSIRNNAFGGCTSLTDITIPNGVTELTANCFYNCTSLKSITISKNVTSFENNEIFLNIPSNANPTPLNAATLYTTPLNTSNPVYNYFKTNFTGNNQINYLDNGPPPPIPIACFKENSKILTSKGYTPIQDLIKGDLIKTIKNGYKKIDMIGFREIYHPSSNNRIKEQLYKCSQTHYPEVFEDLIITGCHCILVDEYKNKEQCDKCTEVNGRIFSTDDKWRLPACVDERATVYEKEGNYTIYHLALENDDYFMNYGIYANGLIVETCSKRYLKELSNMTLIE